MVSNNTAKVDAVARVLVHPRCCCEGYGGLGMMGAARQTFPVCTPLSLLRGITSITIAIANHVPDQSKFSPISRLASAQLLPRFDIGDCHFFRSANVERRTSRSTRRSYSSVAFIDTSQICFRMRCFVQGCIVRFVLQL